MKPKPQEKTVQEQLFRNRLDVMLDRTHPLFVLAGQMDWATFEIEFGNLYTDKGRPGISTRLIVGLHYLKHTFNESDESVVARFVENPYWQYFCGLEFFTTRFPIDPSSMTRWRHRIGPKGMKLLLAQTIETAKRRGDVTAVECSRVNVDTTVQEKAVAHPTDARLYHKARLLLVRLAKEKGIILRQTYTRLGKEALRKQGNYAHAKQFVRARKQTRKLKTYLGCVLRNLARSCKAPDRAMAGAIEKAQWIYEQKRHDKNKVYSVHALEVECIAKGKAHKPYEFGCKVSVVSTSKNNWVLASNAIHSNPYDGHTLKESLASATSTAGFMVKQAFVDKGYRGAAADVPDIQVIMTGMRGLSKPLKRWLKRRNAVEPVISHLKHDHRMHRNHLQGWLGDQFNAILAGCGYNFAKLYRAVALFIRFFLAVMGVCPASNGDLRLSNASA